MQSASPARVRHPYPHEALVAWAVGACLAFVHLLFYSGVSHNPDEWFYLQGAAAVLQGDLAAVSAHGWLYSLALAPFYAISTIVPQVGTLQAALLINIVVIPLTAGLLYACLTELGGSRPERLATALAYGLATIAWPQGHYLLREPMAALFLLLATWAAIRFWRRPSLAALVAWALAMACSLATKIVTLALLPFYGALIALPLARLLGAAWEARWPRARAGRLTATRLWTAGVLAVLLLVTVLSWRSPFMHRFVPTYIHYLQRSGPNLANFAGLWVSPGWGILLFSPVLWIGLLGAPSFIRRYPAVAFVVLGGSVAYTVVASPHPWWWGNWGFGPRQMVPLLPLLCLPLPQGFDWLRRRGAGGVVAGGLLIAVSVFFQLVGLAAPYGDYVRRVLFPAGINGPDLAWNLQRYPIADLLRFLRPDGIDIAWIAGRASGSPRVRWEIVLPLALAALGAGAWLAYLARARAPEVRPSPQEPLRNGLSSRGAAVAGITLLIALAWLPVAFWAVRAAYADERYQPELGFAAAAEIVRAEGRPGDLLVTDQWTENLTGPVVAFLNYCRGGCPARLDLIREDLTDRKKDWQTAHLADLAGYRRAWLVLERVAEGDPTSIVEQWLGQVAYRERCQWTGPQVRLCLYSLGAGATVSEGRPDARFGDAILLREATVREAAARDAPMDAQPGTGAAPSGARVTWQVELKWEALARIEQDYVVSVQLLGADGSLLASTDALPGAGFQPTTSWAAGQVVGDRFAVEAPANAPPGPYELVTLVYDRQDGQRLPVEQDGAALGDHLRLLP